jgi:hypothetical protein
MVGLLVDVPKLEFGRPVHHVFSTYIFGAKDISRSIFAWFRRKKTSCYDVFPSFYPKKHLTENIHGILIRFALQAHMVLPLWQFGWQHLVNFFECDAW